MVTTDCVVLRVHDQTLETVLIRRGNAPFKGHWALPGGFIKMNESLEHSAIRELGEETGLDEMPFLIQLGAYGDPGRDPRGRVVTVAFIALISGPGPDLAPGDDAAYAQWHPVESLPARIAFDHPAILGDALSRLAAGSRTSAVLFAFLGDPFTEQQLRGVLRAVYGVELDPNEYLAPFLKMKIVRRMRGGKRYRKATHAAISRLHP